MKTINLAFVISILLLHVAALHATQPNIVIILADDMGYSDIGCYGSEIETPNLDRLAENGLRFTQFYNTSRCCPTRASLLTGLYSHQAGIGNMVGDDGHPSYRGFLTADCVTIAEVLKEAGYATLMSGKWHVGEERPHWPIDRGFDQYYGLISGAMNYFDLRLGKQKGLIRNFADNEQRIVPHGDGFYTTDAFSERAIGMLDSVKEDQPFFLYLAYNAPHWPLHAPEEAIQEYQGKYMKGWEPLRKKRLEKMRQLGVIDSSWEISEPDEEVADWASLSDEMKATMDRKMAVYAAQIHLMDAGIGRVIEKIRGMGRLDNTLLLFLADNGGCHEGGPLGRNFREDLTGPIGSANSFHSYGRSWANVSNTPFRMYKHWVHEGGISSPLIAHWPSVIQEGGKLTGEVGHLIDLMATCVDIAGATYPETYNGSAIEPLEGKSLAPVFRGEGREGHEALFWEHSGNRAVRKGDWKLVSKDSGKWELYDLKSDRTELHDLSEEHPDTVKELDGLYQGWAKKVGALTPKELAEVRRENREKG
ncbi:MAG: arylsulfatase [Candidatus Omnitrophica bacterium]|nr:arylsulfatase [Candidatus Omnitrophota bacterium]